MKMKIKMCEIRGKKLITNWNLSVLNLPFHLDFDGWRLGYRKQFLFVYLFSLQADETFGGNSQQDVGRTHLDVISSWPQCLPASPQVKMLTGRLDSRFPPEMLQSEQNKTMLFLSSPASEPNQSGSDFQTWPGLQIFCVSKKARPEYL